MAGSRVSYAVNIFHSGADEQHEQRSGIACARAGHGPAALIRTAIELFGVDRTRDALFPVIRSMPVRIRPPEKVALSRQLSRAYKANTGKRGGEPRLDSSITYREHAHAAGILTVYVRIPAESEAALGMSLANISYWGQSSSLANCMTFVMMLRDPGNTQFHWDPSMSICLFRRSLVAWPRSLETQE